MHRALRSAAAAVLLNNSSHARLSASSLLLGSAARSAGSSLTSHALRLALPTRAARGTYPEIFQEPRPTQREVKHGANFSLSLLKDFPPATTYTANVQVRVSYHYRCRSVFNYQGHLVCTFIELHAT